MCFGTYDGCIIYSDANGNNAFCKKVFDEPVNDISIDSSGDLIVACCESGKVASVRLKSKSKDIMVDSFDNLNSALCVVCVEDGVVEKRERTYVLGIVHILHCILCLSSVLFISSSLNLTLVYSYRH